MKKLLLLSVVLIVSCNLDNTAYTKIDYSDEMNFYGYDFETINDVLLWIQYHIRYVSDSITFESDEYWQSPIQTYEWRAGDCEDFAILAMYMVHVYLNIPPEEIKMVIGIKDNIGHAWIEVKGTWYEPQGAMTCNAYKKTYTNIRKLSYDEVMRRATTTHRKLENK